MGASRHQKRSWRISSSFFDYVVLRAGDVPWEERAHQRPKELVESMVDRWMRNHSLHGRLVELYECLGGCFPLGLTLPQWQDERERLRQTLIEGFRRERLVALYEERVQGSLPPKQAEPAPAMPESTTTWITLQFEDEDGNRLPGQRCRLTLSNDSLREDSSGDDGTLHIENIPRGSCALKLLDIDEPDWRH